MGKKIMFVCGSPRKKGNTNTIVKWIAKGAKEAGAELEIIDAASLNYKTNGCTACMGCKKSDKYECVINDDAKPLLAKIPEKDVLIFATPVYFFGPSAQLKLFLDRMYSLFKIDAKTGEFIHPLKGLKMVLVATSGGPRESCLEPLERSFSEIARLSGLEFESFMEPFAPFESKELQKNEELKQKAIGFGKKLAG